jgi:hypothetical protein
MVWKDNIYIVVFLAKLFAVDANIVRGFFPQPVSYHLCHGYLTGDLKLGGVGSEEV